MQPSSTPSPNPDDTTLKVLSYVMHTSYFEYLRNHYLSFRDLSKNDLLILFKSAQYLRIINESRVTIGFNQPTICVIIYGEVIVEGKSFLSGKFFVIGQVKLPLVFKEKSLIVMLNKETIQAVMQGHEGDYFKKKLIEKLLSPDFFKLSKNQIKILIDSCDFINGFGYEDIVKPGGKELGLLLLLDGTFSIIGNDGIKIEQISLEYFGEEILWQKDYQFGLKSESVEYRYIFLPREILNSTFNESNIKVFKTIYDKKILLRRQMSKNLQQNINLAKNFVEKINLSRKPAAVNTEYPQPTRKRLKKHLNFQNIVLSNKINNASNTTFVPMRKHTRNSDFPTERMSRLYDDSITSHQAHLKHFEPKLYRDQKAKTQFIFRRRVKSQASAKASMNQTTIKEAKQPEKVVDRDIESIRTLPQTLSVLLKYYESTEKFRPRPKTGLKTVQTEQQGAFAPGSKERRIMTTMKLHKQIFVRQYFDMKAQQDKAFKTWH